MAEQVVLTGSITVNPGQIAALLQTMGVDSLEQLADQLQLVYDPAAADPDELVLTPDGLQEYWSRSYGASWPELAPYVTGVLVVQGDDWHTRATFANGGLVAEPVTAAWLTPADWEQVRSVAQRQERRRIQLQEVGRGWDAQTLIAAQQQDLHTLLDIFANQP